MTTIEKNLANDKILRDKVLDILPHFTGCDFKEAQEILDALKYVLVRNTVFDYDDSEHAIHATLDDLAANV